MITLNKDDAFTIVDIICKAQEVIRCKECKYYGYNGMNYCTRVVDEYSLGFLMDADDFCSKGEKR